MLKNDSKAAKNTSTPLIRIVGKPNNCKTNIIILNNNPIRAANLFGGKYTGLIGSLNVFTNQSLATAKGLYLPKSKERSAKSITNNTGKKIDFIRIYETVDMKTNKAISLILLSLVVTGVAFAIVLIC